MFPMTVTISNPAQLTAVMAAPNSVGIEPPKEEVKSKAVTKKRDTAAAKPEATEVAQVVDQKTEPQDEQKAEDKVIPPTYQVTAQAVKDRLIPAGTGNTLHNQQIQAL